jgi:hypothetical protein
VATGIERALQRTTTQWADIAEAQRSGRRDGEAFSLALKEHELQERQERLTRLAWGAEGEAAFSAAEPQPAGTAVLRLEHDMEQLAAFHQAVLESRAWRLVQRLRRPFGRAW